MNIFDRDMSLKANNQHYVKNDIDRQIERRKNEKKIWNFQQYDDGDIGDGRKVKWVELSSNVDSMFIDFVSYVHILSCQWIRSDNRRVWYRQQVNLLFSTFDSWNLIRGKKVVL